MIFYIKCYTGKSPCLIMARKSRKAAEKLAAKKNQIFDKVEVISGDAAKNIVDLAI